jgi:hypothetical protein
MAGLVLGIHVAPAPRGVVQPVRGSPTRVRALDLWVTARDSSATGAAGYGYVLQQGRTPPARDSVQRPGTPLHLTRGGAGRDHRPQHARRAPSRCTGTAWSSRAATTAWAGGAARRGASRRHRAGRVVRRALHAAARRHLHLHTHDEAGPDLAGGLYGALVVHDPGSPPDPAREHLVVMGAGTVPRAPRQPPVPYVNGRHGHDAARARGGPARTGSA